MTADRFTEMARELLGVREHIPQTQTLVVTTPVNVAYLAAALRRVAEEERADLVRVFEDDADGSPGMIRIGLMRAIEIIRLRGAK
jgi:hypothetical protein